MAARSVALLSCLLGSAVTAQAEGPLISTELASSTYELLSEVYTTAYSKAGVDQLLEKVPWDEISKQVQDNFKKLPPEAQKTFGQMQTAAVETKKTVVAQVTRAYDAAYAPASDVCAQIVAMIETSVPSFKGLIGKGPGNLGMFVTYMCIVLYVALKVVLFVLRLAWSIFCCCCCCGCCRSSKPKGETAAGKKGKAKAEAKAKAAPAANGKAAPNKKK